MECYDVDFYHKENGDCPVDDFLESLDTKMRAKVLGAVALLEANGPHCWDKMFHQKHFSVSL